MHIVIKRNEKKTKKKTRKANLLKKQDVVVMEK